MDLSAEQFAQIILSAGTESLDAGRDERTQPRVELQACATIIPLSEKSSASSIQVKVRDLSPSGIGFLRGRQMQLDEQFALVLPRTGDTPSVLLCTVAFWQPVSRDEYAMGARFTRILRDGGKEPLPVQISDVPVDLAAQFQQVRRMAS